MNLVAIVDALSITHAMLCDVTRTDIPSYRHIYVCIPIMGEITHQPNRIV